MIKTVFNHLSLNVSDSKISFPFYKDLLLFLSYKIIHEDKTHLGMRNGPTDIWLKETPAEHKSAGYHRKRTGITHFCFGVKKREDVERFHKEFLISRKIKTLYGTPSAFPQYTPDYYAVFFEDPNRIKIEVAFVR
ncbi:MAG: VOC family protein [Candidatus Woesearchaeota archaeon]|nr:VOC family protein [Candidatus Woesearchaeota archaeon]